MNISGSDFQTDVEKKIEENYQKLNRFLERQTEIADSFKKAKINGKLSHAYLIKANKNIDALSAARFLAMLFYCSADTPCFTCSECRKILGNFHSNLKIVEPDGTTIKKEQIQGIQEEFIKASLVEGARFFAINKAEKMSSAAANSLLKFLEEPTGKQTYGILITENIDLILPTILSRCQLLTLKKMNAESIHNDLKALGFDEEKAYFISRFSQDINDAEAFMNDPIKLSILEKIPAFVKFLSERNNESFDFYREIENIIFIDRECFRLFVDLLTFFYIDIYKIRNGYEKLFFLHEKAFIEKFSQKISKAKIINKIDYLIEISANIDYNINSQLSFDQLYMKLRG
ncbi:MAG: hypothetical protein FWE36_08065 [Erysipelotrichales bacterium]|nr:hypothetical protein [Erysipelotrichales bacterium]